MKSMLWVGVGKKPIREVIELGIEHMKAKYGVTPRCVHLTLAAAAGLPETLSGVPLVKQERSVPKNHYFMVWPEAS